jgi:hypothetical protein
MTPTKPPRRVEDAADDTERKVLTDVQEHGWHVMMVVEDEDDETGFAFTIGLPVTFGHPELLVVGLSLGEMPLLLNTLGEQVRAGRRFTAGEQVPDILEGADVAFREVARDWYREYLGYARWYHQGPDFETLQVVYPDAEGRFPWQRGVSEDFRQQQPVLDGPWAQA